MQNPKTLAIINALAVVLLGYHAFFAEPTSSTLFNALLYFFFAVSVAGLIWAIVKLSQ